MLRGDAAYRRDESDDLKESGRALRAKGLKTPILALSASAMPTDVHKGHAAGFDAYLTKPISPHDLLRAVRSHTRTAA